jgi:uncharacterized membrane protein YgdD (TMEM256/DUF423 family)
MKQLVLVFGAFYGMVSVILGAFGAHAFKSMLSVDKLASFQTGVKYQMYHALLLLVLGFVFKFESAFQKGIGISFIIGTFLFSFSIYFLSFADYWKVNLRFLGPITPLGGLLLIIGWGMLLYFFIVNTKINL